MNRSEMPQDIERVFQAEKSKYRNDSDLVLFKADGTQSVDKVRGYGWPAIISGKIERDEYNVDWDDKDTRIDLTDQMLFGDPHTGALYLISETSIKSATWEIEPAKADDKPPDKANTQEAYDMHAERIKWNLFDGMARPFTDYLVEAATMLAYGSALQELDIRRDDEKMAYWHDWGFRHQGSIEEWITKDGALEYVLQKSGTGDNQKVPDKMQADNLLLFAHRRWGMDFECGSKSIFRNCGKPWKMKQDAEVLAMMHYMRFGVGIPTLGWDPDKIKMGVTGDNTMMVGERPTADTPDRLIQMLKGVQAHHLNYFLEGPYKWRIEAGNGIAIDILNYINYCKESISHSAMHNLMSLGSGGSSGNRALGGEFRMLIYNSINSIIKHGICAIINRSAIPQMVNLNWNGVRKYPKLTGYFTLADFTTVAAQVKDLCDAGLKDHVDKVFWEHILYLFNWKGGVIGIPDASEAEEMPIVPTESGPKKTEPKDSGDVVPADHPEGEGKPGKSEDGGEKAHKLVSGGTDLDYKTWRKIKPEERFVAFKSISKSMNDYRSDLTDIVDRYRNRQVDAVKKLISKMSVNELRDRKRILTFDDLKELNGLDSAVRPLISKIIKAGSKEVRQELARMGRTLKAEGLLFAKYQIADEMGAEDFSAWLAGEVQHSTENTFLSSTLINAQFVKRFSIASGDNPAAVADYVAAQLVGQSRNAREVSLGMFVNEAFGFGREAEFFNQKIEYCQRSAVNDERVCEVCALQDGERVRFRSSDYYYLPDTKNCLGNARCRCIWFLFEEEGK
jgi:hypothetical protein